LVDKDTKTGAKSIPSLRIASAQTNILLGVGNDEVSPRWPPPKQVVVAENAVYEVAAIPMSSIALVTNQTIKVRDSIATQVVPGSLRAPKIDVNAMLERRLISALKTACSLLENLYREWEALPHPPEAEWPRMRSLEFQEALREHDVLVRNLDTFTCMNDSEFDAKVG
jgi:antiviral helicase SKI2